MDSASADGISLETVGPHNLTECGIGCVTNPRHEGFAPKVAWLRKRFEEGLRFLLFRDADGRPLAFLEYVPGEYAWRPVDAPGWLFVQCLWVYPRGQKVGGLGTRLIRACLAEARRAGKIGVAAMVSEGPWMAGRQVFERSEFERVAQADRFELLVRKLGRGRLPAFRDVEAHRSTGRRAAPRLQRSVPVPAEVGPRPPRRGRRARRGTPSHRTRHAREGSARTVILRSVQPPLERKAALRSLRQCDPFSKHPAQARQRQRALTPI
jgi:hypothetical protein